MKNSNGSPHRGARAYTTIVGVGLAAGLLSGLFGVGGGTVIVPLLMLLVGFDQHLATGTSLAAIVPIATVGVISYAAVDAVAWVPALLLASGAVFGAQIGTRLLPRVPASSLRWAFVVFLVIVMVSLFLIIPDREATFELGWAIGAALVLVGFCTGIVSGLIGVGGGVIIVPVLMLAFGTSDLVAKGSSLLMMIPAALSGTFGNLHTKNVDLLTAGIVGIAACTTTALGAWLATLMDPLIGNMLFAVYLGVISVQMSMKALKTRR